MKAAEITDDLPTFQARYNPNTSELSLNEDDSIHAIKVLRLSSGSFCFTTDGKGGFWKTQINQIDKTAQLQIIESFPDFGEANYQLRLVVGMIKHQQHWEWLLEKATEIGVSEIIPIYCKHTDKYVKINLLRSEKILWSALKQCRRSRLPILHNPITFIDWLNTEKDLTGCWLARQGAVPFSIHSSNPKFSTCIIGPEGDFSQEEIKKMKDVGFPTFSIGKNRLRTETAAFIALTYMNIANNQHYS
ncbi:MAG: 16S rRNA (uracil(1498)-N(3))-methyltransferase [Bacteroidia bacterium]|nr:16S rRNA (uracil(1498)-N(3))-methyltransferase [Bacteroidia bacterium]